MDCLKCKAENPDGKKYCGDCGAPLDLSFGPLKELVESSVRLEVQNSLKEYIKDQKIAELEV